MPLAENFNLKNFVKDALREDGCVNDVTTKSLGLRDFKIDAVLIAKERGVCAGLQIAAEVFKEVDSATRVTPQKKDGQIFREDVVLAKIRGKAASILAAERTALNLLTRLTGIATLTREFVQKLKFSKSKIFDTRKTTPGLRLLEKYAVRMGGGYNHRQDLSDAVLIKDNHIAALRKTDKDMSLMSIISRIQKKSKSKIIEVEVETLKDFKEALAAKPDIIMLDNMTFFTMRECVRARNRVGKSVKLEISGNVTLQNIEELGKLDVERISIGGLTHSPRSLDISLKIVA